MAKREKHYYPVAIAGIALSQLLAIQVKETGSSTILPCLFDGVDNLDRIYCILTFALFRLFNERNADYLDFMNVKEELQKTFGYALEHSNTVAQFARQMAEFNSDSLDPSQIKTTAVYEWGGSAGSVP